jgi:hypothetical protein
MDANVAAKELAASLPSGAVGAISVSVWYDRDQPYIRVYLGPEAYKFRSLIPGQYGGFSVDVREMPLIKMH